MSFHQGMYKFAMQYAQEEWEMEVGNEKWEMGKAMRKEKWVGCNDIMNNYVPSSSYTYLVRDNLSE